MRLSVWDSVKPEPEREILLKLKLEGGAVNLVIANPDGSTVSRGVVCRFFIHDGRLTMGQCSGVDPDLVRTFDGHIVSG